jgi:hypothetical protein
VGRRDRGTIDHIFTIRAMQEHSLKYRVPFCAAFVDVAKAFDSVPRELLFHVLSGYGFPSRVVNLLASLHEGTRCRVRVGGHLSSPFPTASGVQQGAEESSDLFNLFIFACIEPILPQLERLGARLVYSNDKGRKLSLCDLSSVERRELVLSFLLFIDDTTLIAESPQQLRTGLALLHDQFKKHGLNFNFPKTECVHFAGLESLPCTVCDSSKGGLRGYIVCQGGCERAWHPRCLQMELIPEGAWSCDACGGEEGASTCALDSVVHPHMTVAGSNLKWATEVKYLGVRFSENCSLDPEIATRIGAARGAFRSVLPAMRASRSPTDMARIFVSIVSSVLLYGAEAWALSPDQIERLEVFQRSCVRSCSPRLPPEIGADGSVKFRYPEQRFFPPSVASQIERKQLRWLGHLARREPLRIPLIMLSAVRRGGSPELGKAHFKHYLCGQGGAYDKLIKKHFTSANLQTYFGTIKFKGRRPQWPEAATHSAQWGEFAAGAPGR